MQVKSFLSQHRVACGVEAHSQKRALQTLAELVAKDLPDLNADQIFLSMTSREKLGSTGLGNGIAIPHCRLKDCTKIIGALIQLNEGIDYNSIDGKPVNLMFALIVPEDAHDAHLQTLAALVERLTQEPYLKAIRNATTDESLYQAAISLD